MANNAVFKSKAIAPAARRLQQDLPQPGRRVIREGHPPASHGPAWPETSSYAAKPAVNGDILKWGEIQIERKTFVFALKENPRGRFLRITENAGGRRESIIIPAPGLEDFKRLLDEMVGISSPD
jgi:PurA ssDNA and RNA-binding protein